MRKTHADITLSIDGQSLVCQVPYRYLNQVADGDGFYSDRDYVDIAMAHTPAIETAARARLESHVAGKPLRLERSDFPPKSA